MHILDAILLVGVIFAILWFIIQTGLFSKKEKQDDEDRKGNTIILKVFAVIILLIALYNYL